MVEVVIRAAARDEKSGALLSWTPLSALNSRLTVAACAGSADVETAPGNGDFCADTDAAVEIVNVGVVHPDAAF